MSTYIKTPKGQAEIESRSGELGPRARRLLILVDPARSLAELEAMLGSKAFAETLAQLEHDGYIAVHGEGEAAPAFTTGTAPNPAAAAAVPAPAAPGGDAVSDAQLEHARNFMMNTLKTFNGPYGKLSLMQSIHRCSSCDELRGLFDEWLRSISETRMGRLRADELAARLQAVI